MRIALTRSGGFAGITLHREIDTAELPPNERRAIEELAAQVRAKRVAHRAQPDAFSYEITIDGAVHEIDHDDARRFAGWLSLP